MIVALAICTINLLTVTLGGA